MKDDKRQIARLGVVMSDLNVAIFAFATEGETGKTLLQRVNEIKASLGAVAIIVNRIQNDREQ